MVASIFVQGGDAGDFNLAALWDSFLQNLLHTQRMVRHACSNKSNYFIKDFLFQKVTIILLPI